MSKSRITILSLLKKENSFSSQVEFSKMVPDVICTLAEKDIMIRSFANQIIKASNVIKNAFIRYLFRKQAKKKLFTVDIYFEADHDIAESVFIVGEFTNPAWTVKILMEYSFFSRAFKARIKIGENCQFKFIIDGNFICCPRYPMTYSQEKFTNNVFKINKIKRYTDPKIFNELNGLKIEFNCKREEYMRKKNTKILSFIASKALKDKSKNSYSINEKLSKLSPGVDILNKRKFYQTGVFKQNEMSNQFCQIKNPISGNSNSILDCGIAFKSINSNTCTNKQTHCCSSSYRSNDDSNSTNKFRNIVAHKISRTPMECIHNPLKSHAFGDINNSQRDGYSDSSEGDEFFFIDEYFKNSTYVTENTVYITNTNKPRCVINTIIYSFEVIKHHKCSTKLRFK